MPSGRNDRVAPPALPGGYVVKFLNSDAAEGWENFVRSAPGPLWTAWQVLIKNPTEPENKDRHHKMAGKALSTITIKDRTFDQWSYEVTGAGRIWFCVDEEKRTVWLKKVSFGHPKETD